MTIMNAKARWTIAGLVAGSMTLAGCNFKEELLAPQQPGVLGPGDIAAIRRACSEGEDSP